VHIRIFTDIQKKHSSHAMSAEISLQEHVETAEFYRSDGIIVTGTSTGKEVLISIYTHVN
jgi:predicted TIM-barrel enzyme